MDFEFSADQNAIRELAANLFDDYCSDDKLQAFWAGSADYDSALWQQLAATGLLALTVPEPDGGSGLGLLDLMLVLEQQGRTLAPVPLWRHQLSAAVLARFAAPALRQQIAALVDGSALATLGLEGLFDSRGIGLQATRSGDGWQLQGRAVAVPCAGSAQWLLLPAATDDGIGVFAVSSGQAGLQFVPGRLTHRENAADIVCQRVAVPAAALLAEPALAWLEPRAVACIAALQLGVAAEALQRAVAYTSAREQFGHPLATFQALQQKVADAYIDVQSLRSVLWQLCWRLDADLPGEAAAAVVKIQAAECGHRVSHAAQHMHGGIGVDTSYPIHRFTLWSRALESSLGSAQAQLDALARQLAEGTLGEFA